IASSSGNSDAVTAAPDPTSSPQANTTPSSNNSAPVSSYVAPPEPQIFADGGGNRTVIVAADTEFLGRAYNRKKETISARIRFLWNFGDGSTGEGQSVLHHFEYPGRYAVVLNIADNRDAASDKIIVTAEPAKLAFISLSDGSIMIKNDAGRDLDLSNWIVRSFGRQFLVPKDSIILAGESLRIGEKTLGFRSSSETELDYPNGALALKVGTVSENSDSKKPETPALAPVTANPPPIPSAPAPPDHYGLTANQTDNATLSETENAADSAVDAQASSSQVAAAGATISDSGGYMWWLGAIGLALAGTGAVLASRRAGKREWDIVEEKEG
ncbi:MAG: PKD domain-containing protein, partial [Patescibacteria group bacterium]